MNNELQLIGETLLEKKHQIAKRIHENRVAEIDGPRKISVTDEEIIEIRANLVVLFGEFLIQQLDQETANERVFKWGKETGGKACNLGLSLAESLKGTTYYRTCIWEVLGEEMKKNDMSLDTALKVGSLIDPLLDQAVYAFSLAYVQSHQETLEKAKSAFLELSVPVVPITKGVAILPLIGNIDTERARLLMEEVLQKSSELRLSHLLFDLSGVLIVDTMVADQIFKIEKALSLIGTETILIGIRPEVAQTMISLGIDFGKLKIKSNLKQALKDLQGSTMLFS
jgi:rsbT co-antagonist protein RsbR